MRNLHKSLLRMVCGIACLGPLAARAPAQNDPGSPIDHQFVVTLAPGEDIQEIADCYDAVVIASYPSRRLYLLQTPEDVSDQTQESEFDQDGRLEDSEQNTVNAVVWGNTQSFFVRVEPQNYRSQAAASHLRLAQAQTLATGTNITVAVLDTGVSAHRELASRLVAGGFNFVDNTPITDDLATGIDSNQNGVPDELFGHGTFVAGVVVLTAPNCRILPVKVLDSDGLGTSFTVAAGLYHAIDHGARVVNLSLSTPDSSPAIQAAVAAAGTAGVVVVAAVANNSDNQPSYPAALPGVIAVAATDLADRKALFSDYGSYVALSAPGVDIISTLPDGTYARASGTSFAAAFVTGTAALCESRMNDAVNTGVLRSTLESTAVRIDRLNSSYVGALGKGRVAPLAALVRLPSQASP